jgi:hypothetical protein
MALQQVKIAISKSLIAPFNRLQLSIRLFASGGASMPTAMALLIS